MINLSSWLQQQERQKTEQKSICCQADKLREQEQKQPLQRK